MLKSNLLSGITIAATVASLTACDTFDRRSDRDRGGNQQPTISKEASGYGRVSAVELVKGDDPGIAGALIGAVVGGVAGSQIGGGKGKTLATIAGTVGGAVVGRELQRRYSKSDDVYKITVAMENGTTQTIAMDEKPNVAVGDRVRIQDGKIYLD